MNDKIDVDKILDNILNEGFMDRMKSRASGVLGVGKKYVSGVKEFSKTGKASKTFGDKDMYQHAKKQRYFKIFKEKTEDMNEKFVNLYNKYQDEILKDFDKLGIQYDPESFKPMTNINQINAKQLYRKLKIVLDAENENS